MTELKLGKKPATQDRRDITFRALLDASADAGIVFPKPPATFGHGQIYHDGNARGDWMMLGNGPDSTEPRAPSGAGCCVFSCAGHTTMEVNKVVGKTVTITGKETLADYSAVTGYVLGDESTDHGTNMREAMKYRRAVGTLDAKGNRHKIGAYVSIDPSNWDELILAAYIFSAVEIGFEFQQAQWDQFNTTGVWDYVPGSPNEGGHAIPAFGRNSKRQAAGVVSWAKHLWITRSFIEHLNDETWAIVYPESLKGGKNERGYDLSALNTLLAQL